MSPPCLICKQGSNCGSERLGKPPWGAQHGPGALPLTTPACCFLVQSKCSQMFTGHLLHARATPPCKGLQAPDRDDQEEPRTSGTTEGGGFTKAQPTEKSTEASPVPEEGLASPLLTPPSSTLASPACSALGESLRALAPGHWQVSAHGGQA